MIANRACDGTTAESGDRAGRDNLRSVIAEDPLASFVFHFENHGAPAPGWVERWGEGGDPLLRAWEICVVPRCLVLVLRLLLHPAASRAQDAWLQSTNAPGHPRLGRWDYEDSCRPCADAIRAVVPEPPTFDHAMSTTRGEIARRAWATSERGDELLRLAVRAGADPRDAVLAACDCLELCEPLSSAMDERSRRAFAIIERWARRGATLDELRLALSLAREALSQPDPTLVTAGVEALATAAYCAGERGDLFVALLDDVVGSVASTLAFATDSTIYVHESPAQRAALAACARVVRERFPTFPAEGGR